MEQIVVTNKHTDVEITVASVSNVWVKQMKFLCAGAVMPGHLHTHNHLTLLASGKLRVTVNNKTSEFSAPHMIFIHKDHEHLLEALEENTVAYCIHAFREKDTGDIIEGEGIGVPIGIEMQDFVPTKE
jgi:quercetin dioxygenase-like cupin family protein